MSRLCTAFDSTIVSHMQVAPHTESISKAIPQEAHQIHSFDAVLSVSNLLLVIYRIETSLSIELYIRIELESIHNHDHTS